MIKLVRTSSDDKGTAGVLYYGEYPWLTTIEQPWRPFHHKGGTPFKSCIPEGEYTCKRIVSPRFGKTFVIVNPHLDVFATQQEAEDSPNGGRYACLFHAGNTPDNVKGCIALGLGFHQFGDLPGVISSRDAFSRFLHRMSEDSFCFTITAGY